MTTTRVFCRDRAAFAYSLLGAAVIASLAASSTIAKDEGNSPPLSPNPNSPDEAGAQQNRQNDDDSRDDGPLGALLGLDDGAELGDADGNAEGRLLGCKDGFRDG